MNLNQTFTVLFWQTKSRTLNGFSMVYARVTINGKRIEISTNRKIQEKLWNAKLQKAQGVSSEAKSLNNHIEAMRSALYQHHSRLITLGKTVTPLLLKNEYLGISEDRKTLKEAFVFLIQQYRDKVNIGKMSTATLNKYLYTQAKTQNFIQNKYHLSDILLSDIGTNFLSDLFHYLFTEQRLSNNTAMKYVSRVKTLFLVANGRGWMKSNLVATFKCAYEEESPNRLEMTELLILRNKHFAITRLEEARDCFVFMCYTGFAYADVRELSESNQFIGIDGEMWIAKHRKKTGANECVPFLPPALAIIE